MLLIADPCWLMAHWYILDRVPGPCITFTFPLQPFRSLCPFTRLLCGIFLLVPLSSVLLIHNPTSPGLTSRITRFQFFPCIHPQPSLLTTSFPESVSREIVNRITKRASRRTRPRPRLTFHSFTLSQLGFSLTISQLDSTRLAELIPKVDAFRTSFRLHISPATHLTWQLQT